MGRTIQGHNTNIEKANHSPHKMNLTGAEPSNTYMEGDGDNFNKTEDKAQKQAALVNQIASLKEDRFHLKNLFAHMQTEFHSLQKALLEKLSHKHHHHVQEKPEQFPNVQDIVSDPMSKSCGLPRHQEEPQNEISDVNVSTRILQFDEPSIEQPFQEEDFIEVDPDSYGDSTRRRTNTYIRSISEDFGGRAREPSMQILRLEEDYIIPGTTNYSIIRGQNAQNALGASLRQSFLANRNTFEPPKLFENFLIIGPSVDEASIHIKKNPKLTSQETFILKPKIIFNFAEKANLRENVIPPVIEDFLAPNGLESRICTDIEEFLVKNINKLNKNYNKRFIGPYQPHSSEIALAKWEGEAGAINPQNMLYAICIKKRDFMVLTNNQKDVETETVYCFLTYYPLPALFFDLLVSTLNLIRRKRKELYTPICLNQIDLHVLNTTLADDLIRYLRALSDLPSPASCTVLNYPFNDDHGEYVSHQIYNYPKQSDAYMHLAEWEVLCTLNRFSLKNINLILSAIILEKSIMFFSDNITILSATINTFLSLLTPLKYVCVIIPTLTHDKLRYCEAPVPTIIGINKGEDFFWEKQLEETSSIMIFLDSKTIYMDRKNQDFDGFPKLDLMTERLEYLHSKVNPGKSKFCVIRNLQSLQEKFLIAKAFMSDSRRKKSIDMTESTPSAHSDQHIKEIFNHIRGYIENNVAKGLVQLYKNEPHPESVDFGQKIDSIISSQTAREFLHAYKETQAFSAYPYCLNNKYVKHI